MINHQLRCICVHIPKTAGNSVNRAFGMGWQNHKDLRRYAAELPAATLEGYFKFAIVRNPWERMLSDFNYQMKKSRPPHLFVWTEGRVKRNFREWLEAVFSDPFRYEAQDWGGEVSPGIHRWSPQVDWISLDGRVAVDAVLRMERLPGDFGRVCRALGIRGIHLPHRNGRFHWHYSRYYDDATRKLVGDYYRKDIAAFGYRFEGTALDRAMHLSQAWAARLAVQASRGWTTALNLSR
jgi:hypothetical protein